MIRDLNGDGKFDVAVANSVSNDVSILLGHGDGTFAAAMGYAIVGMNAGSIAAGDLDGDKKLDLAVVAEGGLSVFHGKGDGTFSAAVVYGIDGAISVAAGDLNGAGAIDLAVAIWTGDNVSVLLSCK